MRAIKILKEEMDRKNIEQKDLAEAMHCSASTISRRMKNPTEEFMQSAAKVIKSTRLDMIVFGDTTSNIYFDLARIEDKTTLDRMQQEAKELIDAIQELKENMNYHNVTDIEDCDKDLREGYMRVAEQNKDVNHCSEHLDIALDDIGVDLKQRDKNCIAKYLKRGYLSQKTKIDTNLKGVGVKATTY